MNCTITGKMTVTPPLTNQEEKKYLMELSNILHEVIINQYDITDNRVLRSYCNWIPDGCGHKNYLGATEATYHNEVTESPANICFAVVSNVDIDLDTEVKWLEYIIEHFIGDNPKAKNQIADISRNNKTLFDVSRNCNGEFLIRSSDGDWRILITDNVVALQKGTLVFK